MQIQPEVSGCSIVLLGQFNPSIFHPAWLLAHGVEQDVPDDNVKTEIVHQDISRFSFDSRAYTVDQNRFQIQTAVAPWVKLLDITAMVFGELLIHTPIRAFGVNRDAHFNVQDQATRTKIGRTLAPIAPWGKFGEQMEPSETHEVGGLQSLTMRRLNSHEDYVRQTNARIEPSAHLKSPSGIYMQINSHFSIQGLDDGHGSEKAIENLAAQFQSCVNESEEIMSSIMEIK
jgi:hypothetical protein